MTGCRSYAKRRCCAYIPGHPGCGGPAEVHARADGKLHWACRPCVPTTERPDAAHAVTHACKHPDAVWHDHGCEIPTVAVTIEQVGAVTA